MSKGSSDYPKKVLGVILDPCRRHANHRPCDPGIQDPICMNINPGQIPLILAPLAFYLYVLGVLHSGRWPKVVWAGFDLAFLTIAVWCVLAFGPVGAFLTGPWMGPGRWRLTAGILFVLVALTLGRGSGLAKLLIYNVDPADLEAALARALADTTAGFRRTIKGYEDQAIGVNLSVETSPKSRVASIEAKGPKALAFLRGLKPKLSERLYEAGPNRSGVAWWMFICSSLTMVVPFLLLLLYRPQAREVIRLLLRKLHGE